MDFELEWELKLFREEQPSLFDETGERYSATPVGDGTAKRMLNLINLLESALMKQSEQQSNCNLPQVSDNEVAVCPCNKLPTGCLIVKNEVLLSKPQWGQTDC
jgi:hypothetical protein